MRNLTRPLCLALFMMWTTACSTPDPTKASDRESVDTDPEPDSSDDAGDGVAGSEAVTDTGDEAIDAERPGEPCGTGMVFDCALACVNEAALVHHVGDGVCDDLSPGFALSCEAYAFDNGDCADVEPDPPSESETDTETETETETESAEGREGPGDPCGDGMVYDCDMSCVSAPTATAYIGDGFCDDGAYGIYDEEGNVIPVNLNCPEFNFDEGDCEVIPGECTPGLIEDCNGICAPLQWLGDGFCDDGSYEYNGNPVFFNCEEFNNDEGDCDVLGRTTQRIFNNRVPIGQ